MNRFPRNVLYAALAPAVALAALYGLARADTDARAQSPGGAASAAFNDQALIERGAYLARLGDCAGCHTAKKKNAAPFAGGLAMGSPFGTIYSTNITPDRDTGIGAYSYADFEHAVRDGVAPGGRHLYPAMPFPSFTKISDADVRALYAYFMHGVEPVDNAPPATTLPFPFNQRWGLRAWDFAFVSHGRFEPDQGRGEQWTRGAYLVQSLGHCGACHTPRNRAFAERGYDESSKHYLTGGVNDNWFAPNLTGDPGSGLGRLSEDDIVSFLKTGHGGSSRIVAFGAMVRVVEKSTQYFSDSDLRAVAHYLKSLPARAPSGSYTPHSKEAKQTAATLQSGTVQMPGAGLYMSYCVKCHGVDGRGKPEKFPALAGNPSVLSPDTTSLIRLALQGGKSPQTRTGPKSRKMPPFADKLTDTEIARVLTFVRTAWGNQARPVTGRDVSTLRDAVGK